MAYKTKYKAISSVGIKSFNEQLNKFVEEGYLPFGNISVTTIYSLDDNVIILDRYSLLLSKSYSIEV